MWKNKWLGKLLLTVGAFPVHRESADREALQRAEEVLAPGRAPGPLPRRHAPARAAVIEDLMEGAAFLSARTGRADRAHRHRRVRPGHAQGRAPSRSRCTIQVVIGPAIPPPPRTGGGRVSRSAVRAATEALVPKLQAVYDEAREKTGPLLTRRRCRRPAGGAAPCGPSTRSRARPGRSGSRRASSCPSWWCPRPAAATRSGAR